MMWNKPIQESKDKGRYSVLFSSIRHLVPHIYSKSEEMSDSKGVIDYRGSSHGFKWYHPLSVCYFIPCNT